MMPVDPTLAAVTSPVATRRTTRRLPRAMAGLVTAALVLAAAVAGSLVQAPPASAAPLPAGAYLFAGVDTQMVAIDRVSGDVVETAALGGYPNEMVTGVANGTVYAAVDNKVVAVDASTVTVSRTITSPTAGAEYVSLAVSPDGSRLYALDQNSNLVDVFDPRNGQPISEVPVLADFPWQLALSPDGSELYVVYQNGKQVSVIDTAYPPAKSVDIPVANTAEGVAFSPSGQQAYVLLDPENGSTQTTVAVINTATQTVSATWNAVTGVLPASLVISPDGTRLYVTGLTSASAGRLGVVDTTTGSSLRTVAVGPPQTSPPKISADGGDLYLPESGLVRAVNTSSFAERTYATSGQPFAIALVDMTAPVFTSTSSDTYVAGVAHTSGVLTSAFPRARLSVDGTLPTGITFTDNGDGTGQFAGTATVPGTYPLSISAVNSVGQNSQPYTLTVIPGPPAALVATAGGGQTTAPGTLFPVQPKATLRDSVGNPVPGGSVTFTLDPADAASFSGIPSYTGTTGADGSVVSPFVLAGSASGPLTVTATFAGLPPATFPLTIAATKPPGAPTIATVTPGNGSAEVAFTPGAPGSSPTTGYRVVATDVTAPERGGQSAEGGSSPVTVTGLTDGDTYTFTVTALSAGGNSEASAVSPPVVIGVPATPPSSPTITSLSSGDGSVQVSFTPGAPGSDPTTGYRVTATDWTDPSRGGQTAQGAGSPVTVTGLTNGDSYSFTVTALSGGGDSAPSTASQQINVGIPATISGIPDAGTVGSAYDYRFTVSGAPAPVVTLEGALPPGLSFDAATARIYGTPTSTGAFPITVTAQNAVGSAQVTPTIGIGTGSTVEPTATVPPTTGSPTTSPTTTGVPTTTEPSTGGPSSPSASSTSSTSSTTYPGPGAPDSGGGWSGGGAGLAHTGSSAGWLLAAAALLVAVGAVGLWLSRRRRAGEAG